MLVCIFNIFSLPLNADCTSRLCHLAFPKSINHASLFDTIEFDEFCNCFVAALSEVSENVESDSGSPRSWSEDKDVSDAEGACAKDNVFQQ